MTPDTKAEVMARIAKSGGTILIVGEGLNEQLGQICREHPQIHIWDDKLGSIQHKVPSNNTRAIIYNKFVSHATINSLREFARKRPVTLFPMMSVREIKEALELVVHPALPLYLNTDSPTMAQIEPSAQSEPPPPQMVVQTPPKEIPPKEIPPKEIPPKVESETTPAVESEIPTVVQQNVEEPLVKEREKLGSGVLQGFILTNHDRSLDYSVKGTKIREAKRLLEAMKKRGLESTIGSVANILGQLLKQTKSSKSKAQPQAPSKPQPQSPPPQPPPQKAPHKSAESISDDFAEAEKMLTDARAAIDLFLDFIPKLRKEMEVHRKRQKQIRELLGDD